MQVGDPFGSSSAEWVPTTDDDKILQAPANCLIFVDDLSANNQKDLFDQLRILMDTRYPAAHSGLTRMVLSSEQHYDCDLNTYMYSVKRVRICEEGHEKYKGDDPDEVCEIAKVLGRVKVDDNTFAPSHNGYKEDYTSDLEEHGCYYRNYDGEREVVYNPKIVGRRVKTHATRMKKFKGNGDRTTSFLLCEEFIVGIEPMVKLLNGVGAIDRYRMSPWKYGGNHDRCHAIVLWKDTLETFNKIFGRDAHRHMDGFHDFLKLWKKHGEKTWRVFSHHTYRASELFSFFDYELTRRRPRKRKLSLEDYLLERTDELWELPRQHNEAQRAAEAEEKPDD